MFFNCCLQDVKVRIMACQQYLRVCFKEAYVKLDGVGSQVNRFHMLAVAATGAKTALLAAAQANANAQAQG